MNSHLFSRLYAKAVDDAPASPTTDQPAIRCAPSLHPNPWAPFRLERLPGLQVVITAHNAELWLDRCLSSVERALAGFRWILILVDDGSTDGTLKVAANFPSHATETLVRSFPKAPNVSVAKNRAFALARKHGKDFPAIVPMDADDEMTPERVRHLLPAAVRGGYRVVMGDYQYFCPHAADRHLAVIPARAENVDLGIVGPPMILFHVSLIPANGVLFREDMAAHSDAALWLEWRKRGIELKPVPGKVVHIYHYREGSTSNPRNKVERRKNIDYFHQIERRILTNHTEVFCPKVSALMLTGKCRERYPLARVAVRCFQEQTWPNKELVIVNHGALSLANGDPNIREVRVERPPGMTLGELRNLALEQAQGRFVIQWDDDDFHHRTRIETMMRHRDQGEVIAIRWQIRFNICNGSAYYHQLPGGQQMSILHAANVPFRYPRLDSREDTIFLDQFNTRYVVDNGPDDPVGPLLYVRLFHGRNIWHEAHVMEHLAGQPLRTEVRAEHRAALLDIEACYRETPDFVLPETAVVHV